jgi:hypothetical protein
MGLASLGTFVRRVEHKQQAHFEDSENNTGVSFLKLFFKLFLSIFK